MVERRIIQKNKVTSYTTRPKSASDIVSWGDYARDARGPKLLFQSWMKWGPDSPYSEVHAPNISTWNPYETEACASKILPTFPYRISCQSWSFPLRLWWSAGGWTDSGQPPSDNFLVTRSAPAHPRRRDETIIHARSRRRTEGFHALLGERSEKFYAFPQRRIEGCRIRMIDVLRRGRSIATFRLVM